MNKGSYLTNQSCINVEKFTQTLDYMKYWKKKTMNPQSNSSEPGSCIQLLDAFGQFTELGKFRSLLKTLWVW